MSVTNVALVGATGDLGTHILTALVAEGTFTVTTLQRASSTTSLPAHAAAVRTATLPAVPTHAALTALLRGQDALIVCYRPQDAAAQIALAEAAAAAGVKRVIPADFGSCDSAGTRERELVGLFERKVAVREALQRLSTESGKGEGEGGFSWTSLVCGHFFDWGLRENFLHFDLKNRTADVIDDGEARSSQATLAQVARAVVKVLQRPEVTRNRMLFVQSFCVSQNQVLASLERAMGGAKWETVRYDAEDFIREKKALVDAGDMAANEDLVFVLGAINGNWEQRPDFAMELLGLENEDLDEVVQRVVDEMATS